MVKKGCIRPKLSFGTCDWKISPREGSEVYLARCTILFMWKCLPSVDSLAHTESSWSRFVTRSVFWRTKTHGWDLLVPQCFLSKKFPPDSFILWRSAQVWSEISFDCRFRLEFLARFSPREYAPQIFISIIRILTRRFFGIPAPRMQYFDNVCLQWIRCRSDIA